MNTCPVLFLLVLSGLRLNPSAQSQQEAGLPATPSGKQVSAYISAFNAGESAMREFLRTGWSSGAPATLPLEERMKRYRQIRSDLGDLQVSRVISANDRAITLAVRSERGEMLELGFSFDDSPRRAITRVSIRFTGDRGGPPVTRAASEAQFSDLVRVYLDSLCASGSFSGVVLVSRNNSVLLARACGYADRDRQVPNRPDTRFNIGSLNKVFTRIAVLQLESGGKLSLTDTIGRFLPAYPNADAARSVTIEHLLDMTSGIGDIFGERYDAADREKILSLEDYLPLFADRPLEFEPGTSRRYSNGGFIVLGLIVERASGEDYYDYVRKNVFAPAGMTRTDWFRKAELPADAALGYTTAARTPNYATLPGVGSSAGGGYSTAGDLLRFVQALQAGKLRLPGSEQGFGIAGGAPGLNAALEWDPGQHAVVIVLCNDDPPLAGQIAQHIMQSLPQP